ncbi:MAG: dephospho-CoA kinase [Acidimicrobiales bacterium]|nr:dephospho-CoA kinase [Acidimicrobiales bacterium]MDP6901935.1 dephospho-CoA kinase [Acidimicrobiales bacterium]HJL98321.1 dephospho-CoA kinase [Acidimicrobiales bacterium]
MIVIGLTGGIGSGKSTVSDRFVDRGAILIDADQIVRELQQPGQIVYSQMVKHFGNDILNQDQTLNRQAIAGVVFNDKDSLRRLNEIVHPPVNKEIRRRIREQADRQNLLVLDIPLLVEGIIAGGPPRYVVSGILVVDTPPEISVQRLMKYRGFTEEDARSRIKAQVAREKRLDVADFVIDNAVTLNELEPQITSALRWAMNLPETEPTPEPPEE